MQQVTLRMQAYAYVPELPPIKEEALELLREELERVKDGRRGSTLFARGLSDEDALVMLNELIWFVENHLFTERSSSAS
ncbi:hypothetical protein [Bradyrhizobium sp. USDA 4508]